MFLDPLERPDGAHPDDLRCPRPASSPVPTNRPIQGMQILAQLMEDLLDHADAQRPEDDAVPALAAATGSHVAALVDLRWPDRVRVLRVWPSRTSVRDMVGSPVDLCTAHPLARYLASGGFEPTSVSEVVKDETSWRHSRVHHEMRNVLGTSDQAVLPLAVDRYGAQALGFARRDEYRERDLEILRAAQGPLLALRRFLARAQRPPACQDRLEGAEAGDRSLRVMTRREQVILTLLAEGLRARTIAERLQLSTRTVEKHLEHIYRKLGTTDRMLAVEYARVRGFVP